MTSSAAQPRPRTEAWPGVGAAAASPAPSLRGRIRLLRALVATLVVALLAAAGLAVSSTAALAADGDLINVPDANLYARLRGASGIPSGDQMTEAQAKRLTTLSGNIFGPVNDLTGLERFENLTSIDINYTATKNGYSDLAPLANLTKLTSLTLRNASVSDLSPLANLTNLRTLTLSDQEISDLSGLPNMPGATSVVLTGNKITDVTPLLSKQFGASTLTTLNVSDNRITDISALAPLGAGTNRLGTVAGTTAGLLMSGNRITDFSAFAGWSRVPTVARAGDQEIYLGAYRADGVTVPQLTTADGTAPALDPSAPGSYDPLTRQLTLTATEPVETLPFSPLWTLSFSRAPEQADPTAAPSFIGTLRPWNQLFTTDVGSWDRPSDCRLVYQWFRDSSPIRATRYYAGLATMGSGGNRVTYDVQYLDIGHTLSVRASCAGTPYFSRSAPSELVSPVGGDQDRPFIQVTEGGYDSLADRTVTRSGVTGDPTNPGVPFTVGQLDQFGRPVSPTQLTTTVEAESQNPAGLFGPGDVAITGTGADRNVTFNPRIGGYASASIRVTVTGPSGKTASMTIPYWVSATTTPTSRVLQGISDASSAISVGDGYLLVADDEQTDIGLFDSKVSGRALATFPAVVRNGEIDHEASARKGDTIYWFGSHGNRKDGALTFGRSLVYASTVTGSGANARLAPKGVQFIEMRRDIVAWDQANGDRFGFAAGTAAGVAPDLRNGFNIEGAEFSPDGSELYLGFRSPVVPATVGGRALIVPLENVEELTDGSASRAEFGEPILLDLGGQSIREIRKNASNEYLILSADAGGTTPPETQTLWVWDGNRATAPEKLPTPLTKDFEPFATSGGWEGIGEVPDHLTQGASIRLLMDQGFDKLYGAQRENKDDANLFTRKARTDVVTLAAPPVTTFAVSDPGAFPAQAATTVGSPRTVTVTNDGFTTLNVVGLDDVRVVDEDGQSRDDFLVSSDECAGTSLVVGESCDIRVRFAPSRLDTTSNALLQIKGNLPGGKTTVALTGASTGLPKGDQGDQGPEGPAGRDGANGSDGRDGVEGPTGPQGEQGPVGPVGPVGAVGPVGPVGPVGAVGPVGPRGPVGVAGATGSRGAKGETGEKGDTGDKGETGEPGSVSCSVTTRGVTVVISCKQTKTARGARRSATSSAAKAKLVRNGRTVAKGRFGKLRATHGALKAGRYMLVVGTGKAATKSVVTIGRGR